MAGGFRGILELCGVWLAKAPGSGGGDVGTPSDAFPRGHRGSVTLPAGMTGLRALSAQYISRPDTVEITGDSDALHRYLRGLPSADLQLTGTLMSGGKLGLAQRSSITLGTVLVKPDRWALTKTWPLLEISGDSNTRAKWTWGTPTYTLTFQGVPRIVEGVGGPLVDTETMTLSIAASSIGTIAFAAAHADYWRHVTPLDGGFPYCWFSGRMPGAVAYTKGSFVNDLGWLFTTPAGGAAGGVCDVPVRGTYSIETGGGETLAGTGVVYAVSLRFDKAAGGPLTFSAALRRDQP